MSPQIKASLKAFPNYNYYQKGTSNPNFILQRDIKKHYLNPLLVHSASDLILPNCSTGSTSALSQIDSTGARRDYEHLGARMSMRTPQAVGNQVNTLSHKNLKGVAKTLLKDADDGVMELFSLKGQQKK